VGSGPKVAFLDDFELFSQNPSQKLQISVIVIQKDKNRLDAKRFFRLNCDRQRA
jgi:hypothetical protein